MWGWIVFAAWATETQPMQATVRSPLKPFSGSFRKTFQIGFSRLAIAWEEDGLPGCTRLHDFITGGLFQVRGAICFHLLQKVKGALLNASEGDCRSGVVGRD